MNQTVLDHILHRIEQLEIKEDPYPHFYITNIFPADYYEKILKYMPGKVYSESLEATGRVSKGSYKERYVLGLEQEELKRLPEEMAIFWQDFKEMLDSKILRECLLNKFSSYVQGRFGWQYNMIDFSSVVELISDETNYSIGPHTDLPLRVLTMLFYFPKDESQESLGTSVYTPKDPHFTCEGYEHYGFEGFNRFYTAPFLPNTVFGFIKSDRSFHGVEPITVKEVSRNLLNFFIKWGVQ